MSTTDIDIDRVTLPESGTLHLSGNTFPIRVALLKNGWKFDAQTKEWTLHRAGGETTIIRPGCKCVLRPDSDRMRNVYLYGQTIVASAPVVMHQVQTESGALLQSRYTQVERTAMRRNGVDTDCDDHDLI